ncbi:MAG: succinate dehydrogenase flavoprotein subunit [Elusimicrobia bacterium GWC2_51_8]|nr:MAG: succinate dehydrogenase flavoprotein subunit [Elusimicrobia bacterium GWA2_51_34]OGR60403.1 MAG: succinate dehydrogenase flavoprotein subunit [Elusimicrobia bacterium GWC2_51_8]HAF94834.1 fumarate reductase/succinate dehydrogenase flavoprotein subunit [Elusimicrobiota bacterium]HCE96962.1 fumarate reductase/succinate dehydrogenase flavoprotein subunit [Elusimicrobiota bacterium]
MKLDAQIPSGPIEKKWDSHKFNTKLVNPNNKRKFDILVVGTGLAGASAAASLGELGYNVKVFCLQDTPRRAHSIAAQGGINAAKNYPNDGDSVWRLFHDTIKGGDYRAREANVYRLAQISNQIIDHCAAIGVPFGREYGGLLSTRSFGGAQVSRTFYTRGQTGQQLLLGAYSAMMRQAAAGTVKIYPRREMADIVISNGRARGITVRNLVTGELENYSGHAVLLCTGGYANVFYLSTNAALCNVSAAWAAYKKGAGLANPCFTQIHPTCIPRSGEHQSKLTLMSESLRNDGRIWVPKTKGDKRHANEIPEGERDYFLERRYPAFGNLVPRDIASRASKAMIDEGRGVGPTGLSVYLDFRDSIKRKGEDKIREEYGNLFDMYHQITDENGYKVPMRIYPASHYTMGGLWVDYNLMTTVPGLFALGEANFSDHGANRLGASALMQGLADGFFVIPATIGGYLGGSKFEPVNATAAEFKAGESAVKNKLNKLLAIKGKKTPTEFHRQLGNVMWNDCGMGRTETTLKKALKKIPEIREEFWTNLALPGTSMEMNQTLEKAFKVADFLEFSELLVKDALERKESCGAHFREESVTPEGEARRDDANFSHAAVWEYKGEGKEPALNKEPLVFENIKIAERNYK